MLDGEKGCVPNPSIEETRPDIQPGALGTLRKRNAHGGRSCNRSDPESASKGYMPGAPPRRNRNRPPESRARIAYACQKGP